MSKRLQVILAEDDLSRFKKIAAREKVSLGEWVRRVLFRAAGESSPDATEAKLRAIRRAYECNFPTGAIEQINREIEEGYRSGLP